MIDNPDINHPGTRQMNAMNQRLKQLNLQLNHQIDALKEGNRHLERQHQNMETRLKFEKLLSEISSSYTNLPASKIDDTIVHGLEQIGKFMGADRCNLSQFSEGLKDNHIIHSWHDMGVCALPAYTADCSRLFPYILRKVSRGESIQFSHPDELPDTAAVDKKHLHRVGHVSHLVVPISIGGGVIGSLSVDNLRTRRTYSDEFVEQLRRVGEIFANAVARKQKELEIERAFSEIKRLKEQVEADCIYLREEIALEHNVYNMVGQCDLFKHLLLKLQQISSTNVTVLILGETGTGKELVARAIHGASLRKGRPMVKVNCAALPANLIESELFGHEKGAFTSAMARQVGRFELAHGGTLFLDEIGELPLESQAKLLRVLQEGEFERLGSPRTIRVDVRIIAASNRDLEEEIRNGRFRQDLYYRLNVFPIMVPPLSERKADIPLLVNYFVDKFSKKMGKKIKNIPLDFMNNLQEHHWPGNVRELENVIERAVVNTTGPSLQMLDHLPPAAPVNKTKTTDVSITPVKQAERELILRALEKTKWRVEGPKGAALQLQLNPSTLRYRMRKLGIARD